MFCSIPSVSVHWRGQTGAATSNGPESPEGRNLSQAFSDRSSRSNLRPATIGRFGFVRAWRVIRGDPNLRKNKGRAENRQTDRDSRLTYAIGKADRTRSSLAIHGRPKQQTTDCRSILTCSVFRVPEVQHPSLGGREVDLDHGAAHGLGLAP